MEKVGIEILELGQERGRFVLSGCDVSLANSLRRVMIAQVPTLAPHLVSVMENTSVMHDEFLCHRIGLIPFASDLVDELKYPWECDCLQKHKEDCQICRLQFILDVANTEEEMMEVTSMHIRPVFQPMVGEGQTQRPVLPITYFSQLHPGKQIGIPIVKLARHQEVRVRIEVQKGIGKMHAKWSPVSQATFAPQADIRVDSSIELSLEQKLKVRDSCPTRVFEVHQQVFEVVNPQKCIFCDECKIAVERLDKLNARHFLRINHRRDKFVFTVESINSLSVAQIVRKAFVVLREKLKEIEESIV